MPTTLLAKPWFHHIPAFRFAFLILLLPAFCPWYIQFYSFKRNLPAMRLLPVSAVQEVRSVHCYACDLVNSSAKLVLLCSVGTLRACVGSVRSRTLVAVCCLHSSNIIPPRSSRSWSGRGLRFVGSSSLRAALPSFPAWWYLFWCWRRTNRRFALTWLWVSRCWFAWTALLPAPRGLPFRHVVVRCVRRLTTTYCWTLTLFLPHGAFHPTTLLLCFRLAVLGSRSSWVGSGGLQALHPFRCRDRPLRRRRGALPPAWRRGRRLPSGAALTPLPFVANVTFLRVAAPRVPGYSHDRAFLPCPTPSPLPAACTWYTVHAGFWVAAGLRLGLCRSPG